MPARGEYTRTVIFVLVEVNGILPTDWLSPVDTVTPAHGSAVADLTTCATMLLPSVGSGTRVPAAPPKPVRV